MKLCCLLLLLIAAFEVVLSQQQQTLVCPQGVVVPLTGATREWSLRYAKCYLAVAEALITWEEASRVCQSYGGKLAEPAGFKLTEEVGAIATASDPTLTQIWIGYNRQGVTGSDYTQGSWSDGQSTLADVGVWGSGQPDVGGGDCAYLQRQGSGSSTWRWHLANCHLDLPYLCQATPCPDNTFRCDTGQCLGTSSLCNGENNCGDNSDERNCPDRCSHYKAESQGTIRYPGSGGNYLPTQTCQWVLEGAVGSRLQIQFASLNTEKWVDFVEVWVGGRTLSASTLVRRVSGSGAVRMVVSSNSQAIVRFVSDGSYQDSGFTLTWQSEFQCSVVEMPGQRAADGEASYDTLRQSQNQVACRERCSGDASCVADVYDRFTRQCMLYDNMPRPAGDTCCTMFVKTCTGYRTTANLDSLPGDGGDLHATPNPQRFYSPLYPSSYMGDMVTHWTIHAAGRQVVTLHVLDLDLAPGDRVLVFDGATSKSNKLASMAGSDVTAAGLMTTDDQRTVLSTRNKMLVQFISDRHSSRARGFLFAYQAGCTFDITANTGHIVSPGYLTDLYPNILTCQWTIQVQAGRTLSLSFDSRFALEDGKDYLKVIADGSQIHTGYGFTGSISPTGLLANSGRVQLTLTTGATGRAVGFGATFNAGCAPVSEPTLASSYSAHYGQSVVVRCASEYVFTGIYAGQNSVGIYCESGGVWSRTPFPACARVFCGPPSDITHGYLLSVSGPYSGDTATYACETGFQMSFSSPIKCRNTGSWDQPPFCFSSQSCPVIQDPFQGRYLVTAGNGLDHGSVVNFTCTNPLYQLTGVANLRCDSGQWSDTLPTCERIPCAVPYVANGTVSPSVNVVDGQTLRIDCKPGFSLNGPSIFACGEKPTASCVNIDECQGRSACSQGCVDTEGSFYCTCQSGYALQSDGVTCSDLDECSLNNGDCDGVCANVPGSYNCQCVGRSQLYRYDGQFGISILPAETGLASWNVYHLNHTCIQTPTVECPQPPQSISNGHLLGETGTFTVGRSVTYLCHLGYRAQGPTTLTCQGTGDWSSPVPTCTVATCPVPVVALGTVSPLTHTKYLDYVNVTCDLLGVDRRQLTSRCMWDKATLSYRVDTDLLRCDVSGVDCGTPKRLPGSLPYTVTSTAYSGQFSFSCRAPLFKRVGKSGIGGNDIVTCGADGVWDFGDLRCEGPSCPDPGTNAGTEQVATTYEEFSMVSYTCARSGFSVTPNRPLYCQYDAGAGTLAWNGTAPTCIDTEPPSFANCPSSEKQVTYLGTASFPEPQASDNVMVKELTVTPNDFRMTDVVQTDLQVSYIARDHAGNIGSCVVDIRVKDVSPPQIRCRNSFEEQLFAESQRAVYDPLNFVLSQADDSGFVNLTFSVNPLIIDRYSIGQTYTVKIDAQDPAGNSDQCFVQVKVTGPKCFPWTLNVANGDVTCTKQGSGGYRCAVTCNPGFKFAEDYDASIITVSCTADNDWDRVAPICTPITFTDYRVAFQLDYRTRENPSAACQSSYVTQLQGQLPTLTQALTSLCQGLSPKVTVSAPSSESPVTLIPYSDGAYVTFHLHLDSTPSSESAINQCVNLLSSAFSSVSSSLESVRTLSTRGGCAASEVVRYRSKTQDSVNCQLNQESRVDPSTGRFQCVSCIPGYTSAIGSKCTPCSAGSYFDSSSGSCQFCPSGSRSQQNAASSVDHCYLQCPYGYVSTSGDAPCRPCPEHTYSLNRTYCAPCSPGYFTRGDAQGYVSSCRSACEAGSYSYDGLYQCTPCPLGFFQSQKGTSTCTECTGDRTTLSRNSTSSNQCVSAAPTVCQPNPCNNGTCVVTNHDYNCLCLAGYTGRNCQSRINPCDSNPCYNGAFCINKNTDYECICSKAMTSGRDCEVDEEDDCAASPCRNFGSCQDRVGNHICLCPSFSNYTFALNLPGSDCTRLRDPCQEDPCQNGALCDNYGSIRRKCHCAEGYEGGGCDVDKDYCLAGNSPCQNGAQCQDGPGPQVTCSCLPGYTGGRCEVREDRCSPSSCGVSSSCVDVYTTGQVQCYCKQGYSNVNGSCQLIVIDACRSSPCQNNAPCVREGNGYRCDCPPGYEGANCQHNADDCDPNPCGNGGTCSDGLNSFQCLCPADTTGPLCADAVDQCSPANTPCNPYGTQRCVEYYWGYTCTCITGFYGVNCTEGQTNCASFPCRHGGTCTDSGNSYFCQCPDGFEGPNCQFLKDFCNPQPCFNGGTCVNTDTGFVCKCPARYRGDRCEIRYDMCAVANPCVVSGSTCKTDTNNLVSCDCPTGYTGAFCEVNSATCQSDTCRNGGTCSDVGRAILCSCPAGFSGPLCEINKDDCAGNPCPSSAICVDGVNSYRCVCADDKIGDGCYKDLSLNFDLVLEPGSSYLTSDPLTWRLSSSALTVATWVRFTQHTTPGTLLALYGLNSATSFSNPQHLVRIDRTSATLKFAGTNTLTLTPPIDDGLWHHVALTWEGSTGQVTVYVDNTISASSTFYGQGIRLAPYGWVVLGGTYDSVTGTIDRSQGMAGRLSRLHVTTNAMASADVSRLFADTSFVPTGSQLVLTKDLLNGTSAIVDYDSQLTGGVCLTTATCRIIYQVVSKPSMVQCPGYQMVVTSRQSTPSWNTPSFLSNTPVIANYLSGSSEMGWGHYGLTYTQSDPDGDTAMCTFHLHSRRGVCNTPVPPRFGSQSCVTTSVGFRCEVSCNGDYTRSKAEPLFYSCSQYGMYDTADRVLPYSFASCTTCDRPQLDLTVELNYTISSPLVCATATTQLPINLRSTLGGLNGQWQGGICGNATCSGLNVTVDCPSGNSQHARATVFLMGLDEIARSADNSVLRSVIEVLTIAVVDDNSFSYSGLTPDFSSLVVTPTQTCPSGKVLLDDCCMACGLGHYYNTDTQGCSACPRGTYLDELDGRGSLITSPCKSCPSGQTTPTTAAQALVDCTASCQYGSYYNLKMALCEGRPVGIYSETLASCQYGSYYNLTTAQCQVCPVGFYSESPGTYQCDGCPFLETTAKEGATASVSCAVDPFTTLPPPTTTTADPNVGASTQSEDLSWPEILLLVLGVILLIVVIFLVLFFCFRQHLVKWCPCLVTKVKPEDRTGWHYVDRFGETKMKMVSYNLAEMRARQRDRDLLADSVEEGSVHTNISLQVPVFEEKLNGTVKKKSVHISEHSKTEKREKRKKKKRSRKPAHLSTTANAEPEPEPAIPAHLSAASAAPTATELPADGTVRRPPSAFSCPRPTLEDVPYENFVSPRVYENVESVSNPPRSPSTGRRTARIMIDSDDEER